MICRSIYGSMIKTSFLSGLIHTILSFGWQIYTSGMGSSPWDPRLGRLAELGQHFGVLVSILRLCIEIVVYFCFVDYISSRNSKKLVLELLGFLSVHFFKIIFFLGQIFGGSVDFLNISQRDLWLIFSFGDISNRLCGSTPTVLISGD